MKTFKIHHRGHEINKIFFWDLEYLFEEKGFDINNIYSLMVDEKEYVYVSNGFIKGLDRKEVENGEWHHYFKKDGNGDFDAFKLNFNN